MDVKDVRLLIAEALKPIFGILFYAMSGILIGMATVINAIAGETVIEFHPDGKNLD